jgi:hypothetical protein
VAHVPPGRYRVVACTDKGGDGFCRLAQDSAALLGEASLVRSGAPWRAMALLGRMDTALVAKDSVDSSRWTGSQRDSLRKETLRKDSVAAADSLRLDSLTALDTARPADSMAIVLVRDTMMRDSLHGPVPVSRLWARAWPLGGKTRPVLRPFVDGRARLPLKPGKWRIEAWEDRDVVWRWWGWRGQCGLAADAAARGAGGADDGTEATGTPRCPRSRALRQRLPAPAAGPHWSRPSRS